jgi:hypothetical protein
MQMRFCQEISKKDIFLTSTRLSSVCGGTYAPYYILVFTKKSCLAKKFHSKPVIISSCLFLSKLVFSTILQFFFHSIACKIVRVLRQSLGGLQTVVRQSSGIRQAFVRQSSGSRQAVVRQSSGSRQAVVRQSLGSR